jgi:hypothetical protein
MLSRLTIPYGRVLGLLEPTALEACFRAWVDASRQLIAGQVIAIDGRA